MSAAARAFGLMVGAWLAVSGCSTPHVPRVGDEPPSAKDPEQEKSYRAILERSTDQKAIYDGLDTRLFLAATWQSPEFIQARIARTAAFRDLPTADQEALLQIEKDHEKDDTVFFLGISANDPKADDFDRRNSIWTLSLVSSNGKTLLPTQVTRIGRTNFDMRAMYPYMDTFWVGYEVRFANATAPMQLKVASVLGEAVLDFKPSTRE